MANPWSNGWWTGTDTDSDYIWRTYTATTTTAPPQSVIRCPTCMGVGQLPAGAYETGAFFSKANTDDEICRTCLGSGLVRDEGDKVTPVARAADDPR